MLSYLQGGATHVDIACDPELVKLAISLTSLPVNSYSPKGALDHLLSNCTFEEEILIIFRTGTPYDVFKIQNFSVLLFMMNQYIIGNPIKPSILTFC